MRNDEKKAVPVVWKKVFHEKPWVYPGWLMADNVASVRIAHSATKPGTLFYKPVYMREFPKISDAIKAAEQINAMIKGRLDRPIAEILAAKASLDAAMAEYELRLAGEMVANSLVLFDKPSP